MLGINPITIVIYILYIIYQNAGNYMGEPNMAIELVIPYMPQNTSDLGLPVQRILISQIKDIKVHR